MGLAIFYGLYHTPYEGAHYGHEWKSPLYNYTETKLYRTGALDENLRVKVTHFYPQAE